MTTVTSLIQVVLPFGRGDFLIDLDGLLFSLVNQSIRRFRIMIITDWVDIREIEDVMGKYDWLPFAGPPAIRTFSSSRAADTIELINLGLAHAQGQFISIIEPGGRLYADAYQVLLQAATASGAVIVYGDGVLKGVRRFPNFYYEVRRDYTRFAHLGAWELKNGRLPLLGACLFDGRQIAKKDLALDRTAIPYCNEEFIMRLFAKYYARHCDVHIPIYARYRDPLAFGGSPDSGPRWRGASSPKLLSARQSNLRDRLEGRSIPFSRKVETYARLLLARASMALANLFRR